MVIDNIYNAPLYYNLHKRLKEAFMFLQTIDLNKCEEGAFKIEGNNIKAIISTNKLKKKEEALLETHKKYIDIHIPISGCETFGWKSAMRLESSAKEYNLENDIQLFHDSASSYFTISPGEFAIFLLEDAHAPLIGSGELKKIIFKIAID